MRELIKTTDDLNTFMGALDAIAAKLLQGDTLTSEARPRLAAEVLGFESVDSMNDHYRPDHAGVLYKPWQVRHNYKGETTVFSIALPQGVHPESVARIELLACMGGTDYNPADEFQQIEIYDGLDVVLSLDEANNTCNGVLTPETIGTGLTRIFDIDVPVMTLGEARDFVVEVRNACLIDGFVELNGGFIDGCSTALDPDLFAQPEMDVVKALLMELEVPEVVADMVLKHGLTVDGQFRHSGVSGSLLIDMREGVALWRDQKAKLSSGLIFNYPKSEKK